MSLDANLLRRLSCQHTFALVTPGPIGIELDVAALGLVGIPGALTLGGSLPLGDLGGLLVGLVGLQLGQLLDDLRGLGANREIVT